MAKWIPKNRRNLPAAERSLYQKSKPLFTSREGNYKADGWNKEGKVTYLKYLKALRELFAAKEFYDSLLVACLISSYNVTTQRVVVVRVVGMRKGRRKVVAMRRRRRSW